MENYEVIHKQIPLVEREITDASNSEKQNSWLIKLPRFALEGVMRVLLKAMRKDSLTIQLPDITLHNEIIKTEHFVDAGKGRAGIYFYRRADLPEKEHPLFFFIHGGGFVGGTYLANENLMKRLADSYDIVCASVEYHVAPEARFPTALHECEKGLFELLTKAGTKKFIDRRRVYIAGDSAGGNLAAAAVLSLKNRCRFVPAGQVLLYPVTEMLTLKTDSYSRHEMEYRSMYKMIHVARRLYARNRNDYKNIYFSPLLTTEKDDPEPTPALILLAGRDGLLDDGILYAKHLRKLGGKAKCVVYDDAFHAFINGIGESRIAEDAFLEIADFIGLQ